MDLYEEMLKMTKEMYEKEKDNDSEIVLLKNEGNDGGHIKRDFEANKLYKIIFPTPLSNKEAYILVLSDDKNKERKVLHTEYANDVNSCFIKFYQPVKNCFFFTNSLR